MSRLISIKEYNDILVEWSKSKNKSERFGQFFCNKFDIEDSVLFYETDCDQAVHLIWGQYIDIDSRY